MIRLGMTRFVTSYLTFACLHELKISLIEPVQGESDERNVDIAGSISVDPIIEAFNLDNIVFDTSVDYAHLSSKEELDGDEDDDYDDDDD